ncbi:hypothetical protein CEE37_02380 [candidate division LCP-89 bacterium B3_LCP]|uniref:Secretion system C-terminal sorting domain-containing protein n=1 Tax=candidate division LCP-89 bacterium B3_LCP TaxID=2012998 RepID=A0A532V5S9_UNCL8|nr:MAG: hypothetical protein CEE37_02380 [candidate division LCP-89 bacterium B3_LCP]
MITQPVMDHKEMQYVFIILYVVSVGVRGPIGAGDPTTGFYPPGIHQISFDGSGLVSGIYIYRLTAGDFSTRGKMVLLK